MSEIDVEELIDLAVDDVLQRVDTSERVQHDYVIQFAPAVYDRVLCWYGLARTESGPTTYGLRGGMIPIEVDESVALEDGYKIQRSE